MSAFDRQVVLVTGAGKGAGRAIAEAFASEGARVAANDISPVNLDDVISQISARGGQVMACVEDVAKKISVQTMVNHIVEAWGRIDILVNAANVEPHFPILEMDEWDWHRTVDVNLTGPFLLMQSVGRVMLTQGGGVIINLAPVAGRRGAVERGAYVAAKVGLAALTRQAAAELGPHGIRVNAVCTGLPELATEGEAHEDIATAVLNLCRGGSAAGQVINIT